MSSARHVVALLIVTVGLSFCTLGADGSAHAASPPAVPENISVLIVIIDFLDAPRPADIRYKDGVDNYIPLTVANVSNVFFNNASSTTARYSQMSNGLLTVSGVVIEVALNLNIGTSGLDDWRPAADAQAAIQGYPTSNYDRVGYVLAYGYKDQLRTGGAVGTYFWATGVNAGNAFVMEYILNHEFGHTIGLDHAESIDAGGSITVAGDLADFMGLGDAVHTGAVNKYDKGWLDGVRNADHPVDTAATYDIYPLADTGSAKLQTVVVDSHGALPVLDEEVDTWVSYRKPINFDTSLSLVATDPYGTLLRGSVHVHHARKSGSSESFLDRALEAGDSYNACGTLISVTSINSQRARVDIAQTAYNPIAPQVQVLPQGTTSVFAGTTVLYDLSVTNNDTGMGACEARYDQEIVAPGPGWIANWSCAGQNVAVGAGQVEVFTNFSVQAPIGTAPGVYAVSIKLTNNGGSGSPVETIAMLPYEVLTPADTTPPSAPSNLISTEYVGNFVLLSWTASVDNVGVHTYQVFHNSTLLVDGGNYTVYADFPSPSGGYVQGGTNGYVVRAMDASGNVSAPSNWSFVGDDLIAPSTPTGVMADASPMLVALDWNDSTDNVGVTDYDVHRNGVWIANVLESDWMDASVAPGNVYSYTVRAWDGFGNVSAPSSPAIADTGPPLIPEVPSLSPIAISLLVVMLIVGVVVTSRRTAIVD